ncbi:hypothetical protein F5144DRAFT_207802 [Chaetomium tenue]|uniref:Uncharacterized protein n=1 Tax=Chaetomium tenue TaxID=1854479 RepID=A0ACB7PFQ0_9PEZI|nr:hypothetical protein F5144DRAFT_207802 [Chaetomium globosum]
MQVEVPQHLRLGHMLLQLLYHPPNAELETSRAPPLGLKPGLITCNRQSFKQSSCNGHICLVFGLPCIALQCLVAGLQMWYKEAKHEAPGFPCFLSGLHGAPTDLAKTGFALLSLLCNSAGCPCTAPGSRPPWAICKALHCMACGHLRGSNGHFQHHKAL